MRTVSHCRFVPPGKLRRKGLGGLIALVCLLVGMLWAAADAEQLGDSRPTEAGIEPFLAEARFELQSVSRGERFPNVVVAMDGSVLIMYGHRKVLVRRSEDGGQSWGEEITVSDPGFHGGGATVDETTGEILVFVHDKHPPGGGATAPVVVYRSRDHGRSWEPMEATFHPDERGYVPAMHMSETGITLRHSEHAGRLLRPARVYGVQRGYNTAIHSDDGGTTWYPTAPFPEFGTGEGTVAELSDGRIYYNSRLHWGEAEQPTKRRDSYSTDGGKSWQPRRIVETLPDGPQASTYGCMGGLVRLPVKDRDILLFSNLDTPGERRERLTVWASFDGGRTWPMKRLVHEGSSAYSSLAAGRPGTASEGWIYLHFEGGGTQVARFNLSWVLGEPVRDEP
jgi:sialidase-1